MADTNFVLVAEDDRDDVYLLRWAFGRAGLDPQIIDVSDGALAIDYLGGTPPFDDRLLHPLPSLLVLDLKLPKVTGLDVLAWLAARRDLSWLPVVVLSASSFPGDAQRALKLGAREFLTKPNNVDEFIPMVRGLHARWLASDEPVTPAEIGVGQPQAQLALRL